MLVVKRFRKKGITLLAAAILLMQLPVIAGEPKEVKQKIEVLEVTDNEVPKVLKDYKEKVLDGKGKVDYTVTYQPSVLPVDDVNATLFDADKNMWIGSEEGVSKINLKTGKVVAYDLEEYTKGVVVEGLYIDPENQDYIWILVGEEVAKMQYR